MGLKLNTQLRTRTDSSVSTYWVRDLRSVPCSVYQVPGIRALCIWDKHYLLRPHPQPFTWLLTCLKLLHLNRFGKSSLFTGYVDINNILIIIITYFPFASFILLTNTPWVLTTYRPMTKKSYFCPSPKMIKKKPIVWAESPWSNPFPVIIHSS